MLKIALISVAALAVAAPASAERMTFERDGINYVANVRQKGEAQFISGHADGEAFNLKVANGRVDGWYAGQHVSYRLPAQTADNAVLSSR